MHISTIAEKTPDKPAIIDDATGETITFRQLDERSNRAAHWFRSLGLRRGDNIAYMLENQARIFDIAWGALRAGLFVTPISSRLTSGEAAYIVTDSGSTLFMTSIALADAARDIPVLVSNEVHYFITGGELAGYQSLDSALAAMPVVPIADQSSGIFFFYSSGTTGRPKGVKRPLPDVAFTAENDADRLGKALWNFGPEMTYFHPAPLYHPAPLQYALLTMAIGGTYILVERFDAQNALAAIERHRVTHSQWVPTMFARLLRLPEDVRKRYDLASLRYAIHAAAPCPVEIKRQMIAWWGPIIYEYYSSTESIGLCHVDSRQWLQKPGTVGPALMGQIHIVGDAGEELPPLVSGTVYFGGGYAFEYHNAPEKTQDARHMLGWSTVGDMGYLDEDGYLFLTDRKDFMIISGGVNIYPAETENILHMHPEVDDVAVIGVPNDDFGEEVKAVVSPVDMTRATPELAAELIRFCREQLADVKCPRSVDFVECLPRLPTGKLLKNAIRDPYWEGRKNSRII